MRTIYLVRDGHWYQWPKSFRQAIIQSLEARFQFLGPTIKRVNADGWRKGPYLPSSFDFTDAVIRVYPSRSTGLSKFRAEVVNQYRALKKVTPKVDGIDDQIKSVLEFGGTAGSAWSAKDVDDLGRAISVTFGAIYSDQIIGLMAKPKSNLGPAEKKLAEKLAGAAAHEIAHQFGLGQNEHDSDGLFAPAPEFDAEFAPTTKKKVKARLLDLQKKQGQKTPLTVRPAGHTTLLHRARGILGLASRTPRTVTPPIQKLRQLAPPPTYGRRKPPPPHVQGTSLAQQALARLRKISRPRIIAPKPILRTPAPKFPAATTRRPGTSVVGGRRPGTTDFDPQARWRKRQHAMDHQRRTTQIVQDIRNRFRPRPVRKPIRPPRPAGRFRGEIEIGPVRVFKLPRSRRPPAPKPRPRPNPRRPAPTYGHGGLFC